MTANETTNEMARRLGEPFALTPEQGKFFRSRCDATTVNAANRANPDCIIWTGKKNSKNYGRVRIGSGMTSAHRIALAKECGFMPPRYIECAHVCSKQRDCVNPAHLKWATSAENNGPDKVAQGTTNRGERHGRHRLKEADIAAIKADSRKHKEIAADFGVSAKHISDIRNGKRWVHLPLVQNI